MANVDSGGGGSSDATDNAIHERDHGRDHGREHDGNSHSEQKERHLATDTDSRSSRATGNGDDKADTRTWADTKKPALAGEADEPKIKDNQPESKKNFIDNLLDNFPNPAERIMDWLGLDCQPESKPMAEYEEFACQFAHGTDDLAKAYRDMRRTWKQGADDGFHCIGHCKAIERGAGGEAASSAIGAGREVIDVMLDTWRTNLTEAKASARKDLEINRTGRDFGHNGVRCYDACRGKYPKGMP